MSPLVVLWPSKSTDALAARVCDCMREAAFHAGTFRSESAYASDDGVLSQVLRDSFRAMVRLDADSTTLNVVVVVPLFEDSCEADVARVAGIIAQSHDNLALHVLCLQGGMAQAVGTGDANPKVERARLQTIAATLAKQPYRAHPVVVDDYIATGAPINFTLLLLAQFIATFLKGMAENYDALFPPSITPDADSVISVGIAEARFDRSIAADYLLHTAFVTTLESAGVTQEHVDIPAASLRADQAMDGIEKFYDEEYDKHVVPLLDQGKQENEIAAAIPQCIADDTLRLSRQLTKFLGDDNLSLPEKKATFSLLTGRDDDIFTGTLYDGRQKDLDDALTTPLGIFIDSYNAVTSGMSLLPARDACKYLRLPDIVEREETKPDPRNREAYNPLPELKRLKAQILDQTAFIRSKTEGLKVLRQLAEGEERVADVLVGGNVQRKLRHHVVEQPLANIYTPSKNHRIRAAVDLRPLCSPIRNQGDFGSCTSFAVAAMYEVIVNAVTGGKADLSERFLFYHSNIANGDSGGGSNFSTQFAVIGEHGICEETLYPYTSIEQNQRPSNVAIENAMQHRVLRALQIPLQKDGDRYENIRENHRLLTSALSEGYAVGFSLKIYDDFGTAPGGFVPLPTPSDDDQPSHHAMVIVGYSEVDKCYIVRNSWGEEFGDNGYCYVAAAYVDDPDFTDFACIISETTDGNPSAIIKLPATVTVQFAATATLCQMAASENTLGEAKIVLAHLKEQYDATHNYNIQLLQQVGVPSIRQGIRSARESKLTGDIAAQRQQIEDLRADLPKRLQQCRRRWTCLCIGTAFAALLAAGFGIRLKASLLLFLSPLLIALTLCLWVNLRLQLQRCRRKLQEGIDSIVREIERQKREFLQTQIRFYTAGIVIDEIQKMKLTLQERCQSLISYVNNLGQWYQEEKDRQEHVVPADHQMFITLIDRSTLDRFFEANHSTICRDIDIMGCFDRYHVATMSLHDLRDDLQERTNETLQTFMRDFAMCPYLLRTISYPFLPPPDCNALFGRLNSLAQVATRHNLTQLTDTAYYIAIAHTPNVGNELHNVYDRNFSIPPQLLHTTDVEAVTTFVTMRLSIDRLRE